MDSSNSSTRDRARKQAEREVLPGQLKDELTDIAYWRGRLAFWQTKQRELKGSEPWAGTVGRKITEISEILEAFEQSGRQINRKLR